MFVQIYHFICQFLVPIFSNNFYVQVIWPVWLSSSTVNYTSVIIQMCFIIAIRSLYFFPPQTMSIIDFQLCFFDDDSMSYWVFEDRCRSSLYLSLTSKQLFAQPRVSFLRRLSFHHILIHLHLASSQKKKIIIIIMHVSVFYKPVNCNDRHRFFRLSINIYI